MKYRIVLVVHDPFDRFSHPAALPKTLAGFDALAGEFELVVSVNRAPNCPRTSNLVATWCASREWATCLLHEQIQGASASFNSGLTSLTDDIGAVVLMSADALLIDHALLDTLSDAFDRSPRVGLAHPVSVFEDNDTANHPREWTGSAFATLFNSLTPESDPVELDRSLTARGHELAIDCASRPSAVSRPLAALPLTFLAIRASTLSAAGPLDERWRAGYENLDQSLRAYQAGFASVIVRDAFVMHHRLLFRSLGSYGPESSEVSSLCGLQAWHDKWGADPRAAWYSARFGPRRSRLIVAAFARAEAMPGVAARIRVARTRALRWHRQ